MRYRMILAFATLLIAVVGIGCTPSPEPVAQVPTVPSEPATDTAAPDTAEPDPAPTSPPASQIAWLDTELEDAVTGKQFRLADYKGKPVLLHSFATW
ncbi:MAG: hypothetical protein U1E26_00455 [Coriobacteriia bacterium]|nr:hypothetical protein [Coriobacteriia bacterium]